MPPIHQGNRDTYSRHLDKIQQFADVLQTQYHLSIAEFIFMGSFIVNFVVGKVLHAVSQTEEVYNYYNDKNNVLNQWFVKRGWAWTTVAVVTFYALVVAGESHPQVKCGRRAATLMRAVLKYAIMTVWWVFFTQWCFGLPLMDKIFVWTGGKCTSIASDNYALFGAKGLLSEAGGLYESNAVTSYTCRRLRGTWTGGHDPSGHVFLLTHSSLYLFFEALPFWGSWKQLRVNTQRLAGALRSGRYDAVGTFFLESPHVVVMSLMVLWSFMLFMTNMYFHLIGEKFVGLLFGYAGAVAVYYAPRWQISHGPKRRD